MNKSAFKKAIINAIGVAGVIALPNALHAASFDCAKAAAPIEKLICADETTSKLDADLAGVYKAVMEKAENTDVLKQQQRAWLKVKRNACNDAACLAQVYQVRISELNAGGQLHVPALEKVESITESAVNDSPAKKPISIKFVYGDSYPICKPYLDMLNAARYTKAPTCERKILPQFPQFKSMDWVEMTDRQVIENELTELIDLEYFARREVDTPNHKGAIWGLKNSLYKKMYKYFYFKIDVNDDGIDEVFYKTEWSSKEFIEFNMCENRDDFRVKDSKITIEYIKQRHTDKFYSYSNPYAGFNAIGSNDLFISNGQVYVSSWKGKLHDMGANLNIYGFGYERICGFLIK